MKTMAAQQGTNVAQLIELTNENGLILEEMKVSVVDSIICPPYEMKRSKHANALVRIPRPHTFLWQSITHIVHHRVWETDNNRKPSSLKPSRVCSTLSCTLMLIRISQSVIMSLTSSFSNSVPIPVSRSTRRSSERRSRRPTTTCPSWILSTIWLLLVRSPNPTTSFGSLKRTSKKENTPKIKDQDYKLDQQLYFVLLVSYFQN